MSNGKGSKPRPLSVSYKEFADQHDQIDWRREYQLMQDYDAHWYLIPYGEEQVFQHWCEWMEGKRHKPGSFEPIAIDGPHKVAFKEWRIV